MRAPEAPRVAGPRGASGAGAGRPLVVPSVNSRRAEGVPLAGRGRNPGQRTHGPAGRVPAVHPST